jgi:hypothetical protein
MAEQAAIETRRARGDQALEAGRLTRFRRHTGHADSPPTLVAITPEWLDVTFDAEDGSMRRMAHGADVPQFTAA